MVGRYRLDSDRCEVAFRTRHLFGLDGVAGTMRLTSGEIFYEPALPQASVAAAVSASSFSSGNDRRDGDVWSAKFLHADAYPEFTFQAADLDQAPGRWTLSGELTVRSMSQPVTLTIESVERPRDGFQARATTRIDRYAFGVKTARGMASRFLDVSVIVTAVSRGTTPDLVS